MNLITGMRMRLRNARPALSHAEKEPRVAGEESAGDAGEKSAGDAGEPGGALSLSARKHKNQKRLESRDALRASLKNEPKFKPFDKAGAAELTLNEGDCFKERVKAEAIIMGIAEAQGYGIRCSERGSDVLTYRCAQEKGAKGCPFRVSVRAFLAGASCTYNWKVSKIVHHACKPSVLRRTNYSAAQLAAVVARGASAGLTTAVARGSIELYARGELKNQFLSQVIHKANMNRCADAESQTSRLMRYAELVNGSQVGRMKIHFRENGSLYGFTFAPQAELIMADSGHLSRCMFTDACHFSGLPFDGNIFSSIAMDVGMKIRPLAVTYLIDNETEQSWTTHFESLRAVLPEKYLLSGRLMDVADQDKGEVIARSTVLPNVSPFFCSLHRKKNVLKHCKAPSKVQYERAVAARTMRELNRQVDRFDPKLTSYVAGLPLESQFPAAAVDAGLPYIGHHTSNPVESWNHRMGEVKVRSSPPFEAAIQLVVYCVQKFHKDRESAEKWNQECPKNILKRVDETETHARALNDFQVQRNGDGIYLVSPVDMPARTRLVDLNLPPGSRCSCGKEKVDDNLPTCAHILACTLWDTTRQVSIYDLVPPKYSTRSWREGYRAVNANEIFAPPTAEITATEAERIELPSNTKRPRGRPSAISLGKRRKSWFESKGRKEKK